MSNISHNNVVFITIDSCRFDSVEQAKMPFLKGLGTFSCAETYGSFTLPSHMSMFAGYLPKIINGQIGGYYARGGKQLWRLSSARMKNPKKVDIFFDAETIIDGYRKMGFYALGVGGVRWFRSPILQRRFDQFLYWGVDDYNDVFSFRKPEHFPLNHIEKISASMKV